MIEDFAALARQGILNLNAPCSDKSADDLRAELGVSELIFLDKNENPYGPSPAAVQALTAAAAGVNRYPDSRATALRERLAQHLGVQPDNLALSNGGDNILTCIGHAFVNQGEQILTCAPTFVVYRNLATIMGAELQALPLRNFTFDLPALAAAITPRTKMILLCNPNNPTGAIFKKAELEAFLEQVPDHVLVLLDEAYHEFVTDEDYPNGLEYINRYENLLVVRTFSKIYGLAGLRVGYVIGSTPLIEVLRHAMEDFPCNILAQAAALAALDDPTYVAMVAQKNAECRTYLEREFTALGMECVPSAANFIFVDLRRDSAEVTAALRAQGIFIRGGAPWGYPTFARISLGTQAQCEKLVAALQRIWA